MAKIGDKFLASIAPTNAAGQPAPVTDVVFSVTGTYGLVLNADGTATVTASAAGTGNSVTVTAKSKAGVVLTDTKPLPDVEAAPDEEATAINLTVALV